MYSRWSPRIVVGGPRGIRLPSNRLVPRSFATTTGGPIRVDALTSADRQSMRDQLETRGFAVTPRPILDDDTIQSLKARYEALFRGDFETGVYPDEWHWVRLFIAD